MHHGGTVEVEQPQLQGSANSLNHHTHNSRQKSEKRKGESKQWMVLLAGCQGSAESAITASAPLPRLPQASLVNQLGKEVALVVRMLGRLDHLGRKSRIQLCEALGRGGPRARRQLGVRQMAPAHKVVPVVAVLGKGGSQRPEQRAVHPSIIERGTLGQRIGGSCRRGAHLLK
eukprot:scaffold2014_cov112-Isochrysis_galbana.AAC.6